MATPKTGTKKESAAVVVKVPWYGWHRCLFGIVCPVSEWVRKRSAAAYKVDLYLR